MANDVRGKIRATADDVDLGAFFRTAVTADKTLQPKCGHCGKSNPVAVPDWSARSNVVKLMLEQGYGRPAAQEDHNTPNPDDDPATLTPEQRGALRGRIDALLRAHVPAR